MPSDRDLDSLDKIWDQLVQSNDTDQGSIDDTDVGDLLFELNEARMLLNEDSAANNVDALTRISPGNTQELEIGTEIDGYVITNRIGRGGMGAVYSACQEKLARNVAIKLIRLGPLADIGEVTRTEFESLTTARLNHPGIVRVYDSGHWNGCHYYTMELVNGPTLSQRLRQGPLESRTAVEYVKQICEAVEYAHGEGVLHRDLKPSNVLVAADGKIRITDFGLAKLLAEDDQSIDFTKSGAMMGTPSYMSPEQATGESKRVTSASDVYSIGAVLYELLTGRAPFRAASPMQTMRQVIDQEPASPRSLNAELPADLETVCLKCLQKSPEDRYATPKLLGDDLRRILEHRPISARPVSWLEKSLRWRRRNPALAMTVLMLAGSLLIGSVTSLAMWRRSALNARAAQVQASNAEAVARFFTDDIFQNANPNNSADRDIRLSEVVDSAAAEIEGKFREQPHIEHSIRSTLGMIYNNLGRHDESREHYQSAADLARRIFGEDSEESIRAMYSLNTVNYLEGNHEAALEEYQRLSSLAESKLGPSHPMTLDLQGQLAHLLYWAGDYEAAKPIYESVLAKQLTLAAENENAKQPDEAIALQYSSFITRNNLALLYSSSGDFDNAEERFMENLPLQREHLGDEHPDTLTTLNNLGFLYCAQSKFEKARECYEEALESRTGALGREHPHTCFSIHNMGILLKQTGQLQQALEHFSEAYAARKKALGIEVIHTQHSLLAMCDTLLQLENFSEAEEQCREAVRITSEFAPNQWRHHLAKSHLGEALTGLERYEEAQSLLIESYESFAASDERIPEPERSDQLRTAGERLVAMLTVAGKEDLAAEWKEKIASQTAETSK